MIGVSSIALETGIGYTRQSLIYAKEENNVKYEYRFRREEITIPLMFRTHLNFRGFTPYFSMGLKFGIPLRDNYVTEFLDGKEQDLGKSDNNSSRFAIDFALAIGFEILLGNEHCIGLRLGYDLSMVEPGDSVKMANIFGGEARDYDFDHNILGFSLTYRYKFYKK